MHGVPVGAFIEWDLGAGNNEDRMDKDDLMNLYSRPRSKTEKQRMTMMVGNETDEEPQVLIKSTNGEECNTMFDRTFKLLSARPTRPDRGRQDDSQAPLGASQGVDQHGRNGGELHRVPSELIDIAFRELLQGSWPRSCQT